MRTSGALTHEDTCGSNRVGSNQAQFGLLPQVHRTELDIYDNIRLLIEAAGRTVPPLDNVPNRYLNPKAA
jgi:hypothetical protein